MRRRFTGKQKKSLYLLANGHCSICGKPLGVDWHADHILAYSQSGLTDVVNGQALCASCNLKKGNRGMLPIWTRDLRKWQQEAFDKYLQHTRQDYLLEATPGAGKTNFSLRVAHSLLQSQQVKQVIVVCPTDHLKRQWAREAAQIGIELDPNYSPAQASLRAGFHGITTTYHQVALNQEIFRYICSKNPTCVFFDEIHHAADSLPWGKGLRHAFELAHRRIGLSGTPFRGDNNVIPFVNYTNGLSMPDYSYTYSDSLRDEVCRYVFFPKYEGRMEWISGVDGKVREAAFVDELTLREASERLNTAISITGEWIDQVLQDANRRLSDLQNAGHTNAAGLVIAKDQIHAQAIAKLLHRISGYKPIVAISAEPDASEMIEKFRKSSDRWIVAVKMVSEGVDIPRLRVLVYATNVATELFFRQAVGRVIRTIPGLEEQNAFFFIPNDKVLVSYAQGIQEQRDHQIKEEDDIDPSFEDEYVDRGQRVKIPSTFQPITSEAQADGAIFSASEYSQQELDLANELGKQSGQPYLAPEVIAYYVRAGSNISNPQPQPSQPTHEEATPLYEKEKHVKESINRLVARYAALSGREYKDIHAEWISLTRKPQAKSNLQELLNKKRWLESLIETYT